MGLLGPHTARASARYFCWRVTTVWYKLLREFYCLLDVSNLALRLDTEPSLLLVKTLHGVIGGRKPSK
jgi:hypothetical protein